MQDQGWQGSLEIEVLFLIKRESSSFLIGKRNLIWNPGGPHSHKWGHLVPRAEAGTPPPPSTLLPDPMDSGSSPSLPPPIPPQLPCSLCSSPTWGVLVRALNWDFPPLASGPVSPSPRMAWPPAAALPQPSFCVSTCVRRKLPSPATVYGPTLSTPWPF